MQLTSSQRLPLLGAASRWNRTSGSHQLCDSCNGRVVIDQSDLKNPKKMYMLENHETTQQISVWGMLGLCDVS